MEKQEERNMKHQISNQTVKRKSAVLLAVATAMAGMMTNGGVTATGGTKTMVDGSAYIHRERNIYGDQARYG